MRLWEVKQSHWAGMGQGQYLNAGFLVLRPLHSSCEVLGNCIQNFKYKPRKTSFFKKRVFSTEASDPTTKILPQKKKNAVVKLIWILPISRSLKEEAKETMNLSNDSLSGCSLWSLPWNRWPIMQKSLWADFFFFSKQLNEQFSKKKKKKVNLA